MFSWLDTIRTQPLSKRRLVAFSVALSITGALFVVWLTVWLPDWNTRNEVTQKVEQNNTPKDNFMKNMSTAWGSINSQFSEFKDSIQQIPALTNDAQYISTSTPVHTNTPSDISIMEVSYTATSTSKNQ